MKRQLNGRRGAALLYVLVALIALMGFCSLGVDWGRVQVARGELQLAADAAARYAAPVTGQGIAAVRARAKQVALENTADGTPVVLADSDIEQGNWSLTTKVFVANGTPVNAVHVTARRVGANAVPLMFARALGKETCNVQASAIVLWAGPTLGLDGITVFNISVLGGGSGQANIRVVR